MGTNCYHVCLVNYISSISAFSFLSSISSRPNSTDIGGQRRWGGRPSVGHRGCTNAKRGSDGLGPRFNITEDTSRCKNRYANSPSSTFPVVRISGPRSGRGRFRPGDPYAFRRIELVISAKRMELLGEISATTSPGILHPLNAALLNRKEFLHRSRFRAP